MPTRILRARWRTVAALLVGLLTYAAIPHGLAGVTRGLIGWDTGCALLLTLVAVRFSFERQQTMEQDAEAQSDAEWPIFAVTLIGIVASFSALLREFSPKHLPAAVRDLHIVLVASTLLLSWLITQVLFALRYAHEYYARAPGAPEVDKGLRFPGDESPDYWDFVYFALVLGMTFQVSDVEITSKKLRRLAALQGLIGFLFNTVIIALTVNIAAGLV